MRNLGLMIVSLAFLAVAGFADDANKPTHGQPPSTSDSIKKDQPSQPSDSIADSKKKEEKKKQDQKKK